MPGGCDLGTAQTSHARRILGNHRRVVVLAAVDPSTEWVHRPAGNLIPVNFVVAAFPVATERRRPSRPIAARRIRHAADCWGTAGTKLSGHSRRSVSAARTSREDHLSWTNLAHPPDSRPCAAIHGPSRGSQRKARVEGILSTRRLA